MSLPEALAPLLHAGAYPHPCGAIELVETHISWVLLTGDYVYKLKKPVVFSFVDFSTLERRRYFCAEEVRCNRPFAPDLYLGVVAVVRGEDGVRVDTAGDACEWAVKMRQFPGENQLDRLLARDALTVSELTRFGRTLAEQHAALPRRPCSARELETRVLEPVWANFDDLAEVTGLDAADDLAAGRRAADRMATRQRPRLLRRLVDDGLRECHGDLHLSNLVRLDSGVCAFDCLEFDANLRWLDPQSDVAFLFMDCLVRERADLGYGFLDGYLDAAGDYDGVCLLPFYTAYRAMVRAKVAALRSAQGGSDEARQLLARSRRLLGFSTGWMTRPPGRLVLTCGLSGSGKSHVAKRLVTRLPAVRLRSDVARKARAGVAPGESAAADVDQGLYAASRVRDTYDHLRDVAEDLLRSGERVIVDATFIEARLRTSFLEMADGVGAAAVILYCYAPEAVLLERVTARNAAGRDPSDATPAVLAAQRQRFEVPQERVVAFDTDTTLDDPSLERLVARLFA